MSFLPSFRCVRLTTAALAFLLSLTAQHAAGAGVQHPAGHRGARQRLLVLSVDGLDWRYLRDADRLGLRIPHLRRLLAEGDVVDGVIDEAPTATWPSHTTLITGVPPQQHGILANLRPASEGGEHYWDASLLKVRTLWHAAKDAGLTVGAVSWPVTVTTKIDFNLPEYFQQQSGERTDLASTAAKATPGLIGRITARYPSFPQPWLDDRTRTLAALYITRDAHADLTFLHLLGLDAESHERGPFTPSANAVLEHIDELIGSLMDDAPPDLVIALVSDHGFERTDRMLNLSAWLTANGMSTWFSRIMGWIPGQADSDGLVVRQDLVATRDARIADALARDAARSGSPIGRRIPREELARWAPELQDVTAAFEPAEHVLFTRDRRSSVMYEKPPEPGTHDFWPGRPTFRSVFLLWGPGISARREPEMSILGAAERLARVLGVPFTPQKAGDLAKSR